MFEKCREIRETEVSKGEQILYESHWKLKKNSPQFIFDYYRKSINTYLYKLKHHFCFFFNLNSDINTVDPLAGFQLIFISIPTRCGPFFVLAIVKNSIKLYRTVGNLCCNVKQLIEWFIFQIYNSAGILFFFGLSLKVYEFNLQQNKNKK